MERNINRAECQKKREEAIEEERSCKAMQNRRPKVVSKIAEFARCLAKYGNFCVSIGFALFGVLRPKNPDPRGELGF